MWFQNRRMKWRHAEEAKKKKDEEDKKRLDSKNSETRNDKTPQETGEDRSDTWQRDGSDAEDMDMEGDMVITVDEDEIDDDSADEETEVEMKNTVGKQSHLDVEHQKVPSHGPTS